MVSEEYEKINIAVSLLETACKLYKKDDFFAVINLAGASEEILGKYLKARGKKNALESDREALVAINKYFGKDLTNEKATIILNYVKNALKHYNGIDDSDKFILMDAQSDSSYLLVRALTNLWRLEMELTPIMNEVWEMIEKR
ncbi:MAG: hypothetical protein PHY88_00140 [Candidatus Omnitrophica bacterium]|nr:hypothetical protein [Candidatus Omnitrophota bacterium]